jgi:hypothetical protein
MFTKKSSRLFCSLLQEYYTTFKNRAPGEKSLENRVMDKAIIVKVWMFYQLKAGK